MKIFKRDNKNRYYLPDELYYDSINHSSIIVDTPIIGKCLYQVHYNKDNSCWIKGKYFNVNKLFLSENVIKMIV